MSIDIKILFPEPVVAEVGRRKVMIRPVKFKHFEAFGAASSDVLQMLGKYSTEEIYAFAKKTGALKLTVLHCTSMSRWRLRRLPAAVVVELMIHVIMVNASFFGMALVKAVKFVDGRKSSSN